MLKLGYQSPHLCTHGNATDHRGGLRLLLTDRNGHGQSTQDSLWDAGTPVTRQARGFANHLDRMPKQARKHPGHDLLELNRIRSNRRTASQGKARSRANPNRIRTNVRIFHTGQAIWLRTRRVAPLRAAPPSKSQPKP